MASVTVRNLDENIISSLKTQAKGNNRSLEGEIRHILCGHALRAKRIKAFRERTMRLHALSAGIPQTDSVDLIREDRGR